MTTLSKSNNQNFDVNLHFAQEFKGRGGWNIKCDVSYNDEKTTFTTYTTNTRFIDSISGMRADDASWEGIQQAYSDEFLSEFKERIIEWCENI